MKLKKIKTTPQKGFFVIKASGEKELFSDLKLRNSLEKAQAPSSVIEKILDQTRNEMKDGMKTSDIYRYAFSLLRQHDRLTANRYSLKRAIMEIGPSGYPFEKFVSELLKVRGFSVEVGKIVPGVCVSHEIDVVAQKAGNHIMVECKFHNQPGIKSDVKVALYAQARFEDVQKQWQKQPNHGSKFHEVWLVTNTKLTSDAIQYASCAGMKAIGWSYPPDGNLQNLIESVGLHPLTCLTTLSSVDKRRLLDRGLVLCKEIFENKKFLLELGLNESKIKQIEREIDNLCKPI
ncbi:restriction endonuclease [Candidatus Wolfebacteria bacterium]|nr:restriction endonuclease [Candidatus Wolfebacteria bacterium]